MKCLQCLLMWPLRFTKIKIYLKIADHLCFFRTAPMNMNSSAKSRPGKLLTSAVLRNRIHYNYQVFC